MKNYFKNMIYFMCPKIYYLIALCFIIYYTSKEILNLVPFVQNIIELFLNKLYILLIVNNTMKNAIFRSINENEYIIIKLNTNSNLFRAKFIQFGL